MCLVASGSALSIPYHILLMSTNSYSPPPPPPPPSPLSSPTPTPTPTPTSTPTPTPSATQPQVLLHSYQYDDTTPANYDEQGTHEPLLVPPHSPPLPPTNTDEYSWTKRYWFGASLSCVSFACMLGILATRRESAAIVAPF